MARRARLVIPGIPHHLVQRGNRRQRTFFQPADYHRYIELFSERAPVHGLRIWCYCLMPNHVHLVGVPAVESSLALCLKDVHGRYAREINRRLGWTGHLWQSRFSSFPMDDRHLFSAVRYILQNPVKAKLSRTAEDWPYSSARAHIFGLDDPIIERVPLDERVEDWKTFLEPLELLDHVIIEKHETSGLPLGSDSFIYKLECQTGRILRPQPPGPKERESRGKL